MLENLRDVSRPQRRPELQEGVPGHWRPVRLVQALQQARVVQASEALHTRPAAQTAAAPAAMVLAAQHQQAHLNGGAVIG